MRVKHKIIIDISDDTAGEDVLFSQSEKLALSQIDNWQRSNSGKMSIAALGTENIPFGDVGDVRFVYIKAAGDFDLKFDGGVELMHFKRALATSGTAKCLMEVDVSSITIVNVSASAVLNLVFCVAGDPT